MDDRYKKLANKIINLSYPGLEQMSSTKRLKIEGVRNKIIEMIKKFIVEETKLNL